ncbi:226_t:CDS:2, partial [Cetraspora pellucida]
SDANVNEFEASVPDDNDKIDVINIQTNSTQTEVLTPVISNKLKLKFYFLEICDKEIVKQNNSPMSDIFLNRDLYLEKIKVCQLDNNNLSVTKTFNIGNYVFVFVINYFNWMYQFKMKSDNDVAIKFGETFNSETGDYGMPLMINYLKLESVWKPDFNSGIYERVLTKKGTMCKSYSEGLYIQTFPPKDEKAKYMPVYKPKGANIKRPRT